MGKRITKGAHAAMGAATRVLLSLVLAVGLVPASAFATASAAFATDTATAFATRLYTEVLGRDPDSSGLATQVAALKAGTAPAEIAYNYFNSQEYFEMHETAEQTVERVYEVMFGRASDASGKAMWVGYLESGMSVRAVVQGFSQAQEYRDYFGSAGLDSGEIALYDSNADKAWDSEGSLTYSGGNSRDLNRGAAEFAKRMYTVVLGRDDVVGTSSGVDVEGLNAQAGAIANGTACWQIASNFFGSDEFVAKKLSSYRAVACAYEAILGRSGSESEVLSWVHERTASCYTVTDVVLHFCNSDEFNNLCASYGLTSGMRGASAATLPTARSHSMSGGVCARCGYSTDPNKMDSDGDGLPDALEKDYMDTDPDAFTDLTPENMPDAEIVPADGAVMADADSVTKSSDGTQVSAVLSTLPDGLAEGGVLGVTNGDAAIKVSSIKKQSNGTYLVSGTQASLSEVATYACVKEDATPDLDNVTTADGVSASIEPLSADDYAVLSDGYEPEKYYVSLDKIVITPTGRIQSEDGTHSIEVSGEIQVLVDPVELDALTFLGVPYGASIDINCRVLINTLKIKGTEKGKYPLLKVPIVGGAGCGGYLEIALDANISGELTLSYSFSIDAGIDASSGNSAAPYMNPSSLADPTFSAKVTATIGFRPNVNFELFGIKLLELYCELGVRGSAATNQYSCIDLNGWVFSEVGASLGIEKDIKSINRPGWAGVKSTITIWDQDTSPFKFGLHYEDGKVVEKCTKGKSNSNSNTNSNTSKNNTNKNTNTNNGGSNNSNQSKTDNETRHEQYRQALTKIMNSRVTPDGVTLKTDKYSSASDSKFAVCDVDLDGADELVVSWWCGCTADYKGFVYEYNPSTKSWVTEYSGIPEMYFYTNGCMRVNALHNQSESLTWWPCEIYQYVDGANYYEHTFSVYAIDQSIAKDSYPSDVDTDNAGTVYVVDGITISKSAFENGAKKYIDDSLKIDVTYKSITSSNIATI